MSRTRIASLAGALVLIFANAAARADEGMWTFDNFPSAKVKAKYGFALDQKWLDHLQHASARLTNGCSSSIVSKNGLVLTNNHCVTDCAQNLSTPQTDYVAQGFISHGISEEKQCKGLQAEILTKIEDVTPQVKAAMAKAPADGVIKARDAEIASIETQASCKETAARCQVVNLYQGGQYKLYTYHIYSDTRLVFAPEMATAFFGGDPDNFNFPRYALDSAFLRLYENGKPINVSDYLSVRTDAPKESEAVFVSGNPGATQRLYTMAQLEMQRDWAIPVGQAIRSELRGRLLSYTEQGEEQKRTATDLLFGLENSFKAYTGMWRTLMDASFMASKQVEETKLRNEAMSNPKLKTEIGDPWTDISKAMGNYREQFLTYSFLEGRYSGRLTALFKAMNLVSFARDLVRSGEERAKPNTARLPEYADSKLALLEHEILADNPVYPELERIVTEMWLSKTREYLTVDNQYVKNLLGKESPEDLAARLVKGTKLADPKVREALWKGGADAINKSDDPLIQFVKRIDADARAVRKKYEETVEGPVAKASERIAKARFAIYGESVYPDGTFTLRLSYGAVKGWTYQGTTVAPFTYFSGLYERATGAEPFNLTKSWEVAKAKLNMSTPFDVSTTNDIIGGNSGSPLVDAQGRVVGAVFDGNIHSLGGDYGFDEKLNRCVAVTTPAILEALRKVYNVPALADELEGKATGSIQ